MAKQRPFELKLPPAAYTPYGIGALTEKQLRDEFTRMRDAAQKRVKRLQSSEFASTEVAKQFSAGFKKLGNLTTRAPKGASPEDRQAAAAVTRREIEREFMRMATFLRSAGQASVSGLKQRRAENIAVMQEHGYNVTTKNYSRFVKFMEEGRRRYGRKVFDSSQAADMFEAKERAKLSSKQLDKLMQAYFEGGAAGAEKVQKVISIQDPDQLRAEYRANFGRGAGRR